VKNIYLVAGAKDGAAGWNLGSGKIAYFVEQVRCTKNRMVSIQWAKPFWSWRQNFEMLEPQQELEANL